MCSKLPERQCNCTPCEIIFKFSAIPNGIFAMRVRICWAYFSCFRLKIHHWNGWGDTYSWTFPWIHGTAQLFLNGCMILINSSYCCWYQYFFRFFLASITCLRLGFIHNFNNKSTFAFNTLHSQQSINLYIGRLKRPITFHVFVARSHTKCVCVCVLRFFFPYWEWNFAYRFILSVCVSWLQI